LERDETLNKEKRIQKKEKKKKSSPLSH